MYTFRPAVAGTIAHQLLDERVREASGRRAARAIRRERRTPARAPVRRHPPSLAVLRRSFG